MSHCGAKSNGINQAVWLFSFFHSSSLLTSIYISKTESRISVPITLNTPHSIVMRKQRKCFEPFLWLIQATKAKVNNNNNDSGKNNYLRIIFQSSLHYKHNPIKLKWQHKSQRWLVL